MTGWSRTSTPQYGAVFLCPLQKTIVLPKTFLYNIFKQRENKPETETWRMFCDQMKPFKSC